MTDEQATPAIQSFDRTVADLKVGVTHATNTYRDLSDKAAKSTTDAVAFSQGTLESYAEASKIMAAGMQDLFRQCSTSTQHAMQESLAGVRALMGAKSLKEAIELQATITRTAAIWAVGESSRYARASIDLAEKAAAPITARVLMAAEKLSTHKV